MKADIYRQLETQLKQYDADIEDFEGSLYSYQQDSRFRVSVYPAIRQIYLQKYTQEGESEYLTVSLNGYFSVIIDAYKKEDEVTPTVPKSAPKANAEVEYLCTFMRQKGEHAKDNEWVISGIECVKQKGEPQFLWWNINH